MHRAGRLCPKAGGLALAIDNADCSKTVSAIKVSDKGRCSEPDAYAGNRNPEVKGYTPGADPKTSALWSFLTRRFSSSFTTDVKKPAKSGFL